MDNSEEDISVRKMLSDSQKPANALGGMPLSRSF